MLSFLPGPLKGVIAGFLFGLNTVFWCLLIYPFVLLKCLVPLPAWRHGCTRIMVALAQNWITGNSLEMKLMQKIRMDVEGLEGLHPDRSYLVVANHQSWTDIVFLQEVFNRRIPFLRFFLKSELIWVPLLGVAWWALDFPFMKRYSKGYLEKHPEKRGQDLETTRKACEKFKGSPISVLNFLEGTRRTTKKHAAQNSPYKNLLRPKTGGIAFVIDCMGEQFDSIVDVTLFYPTGPVSLWGLLSGKLRHVKIHIRQMPIPKEILKGNYLEDEAFREKTQTWVANFWNEKDLQLEKMK